MGRGIQESGSEAVHTSKVKESNEPILTAEIPRIPTVKSVSR